MNSGRAAAVALLLALLNTSACMTHDRQITTRPGPSRFEGRERVAGSERLYALSVPHSNFLDIRVRSVALCSEIHRTRIERLEVDRVRATGGRLVGAAAAFIGGSILLSNQGSDLLGGSLIAGGAGVALVPLLSEGEERRQLEPEMVRGPAGPLVACDDRPVAHATVVVRAQGLTLQGESDVAGRVRFREVAATPDTLVYVGDVAVPLSVGDPSTGTSPAEAAPASPGDPGKR
ncbi:MAG: hypothetical protein IPI67_02770 [Myxococcales bacterium]|nr:hypothetical protein [Myxococcales bacterium]